MMRRTLEQAIPYISEIAAMAARVLKKGVRKKGAGLAY